MSAWRQVGFQRWQRLYVNAGWLRGLPGAQLDNMFGGER